MRPSRLAATWNNLVFSLRKRETIISDTRVRLSPLSETFRNYTAKKNPRTGLWDVRERRGRVDRPRRAERIIARGREFEDVIGLFRRNMNAISRDDGGPAVIETESAPWKTPGGETVYLDLRAPRDRRYYKNHPGYRKL